MSINETKKYHARKLRKNGMSYSEILREVKISRSTLSRWLRDIPLSNEQKRMLEGRNISRYAGCKARQQERIRLTKKIISESIAETDNLIENKLFLSGLMLYWAEGTKRGEEMVNFSNSDPNMIILMMKWFRSICQVKEEKFRLQIHIHSMLPEQKIKEYWSKITNVPLAQFHKLIIKKTSLGHRKNILYKGTCCIRVCDKNLFRRIMGWKIGILDKFEIKDNYQIPQ